MHSKTEHLFSERNIYKITKFKYKNYTVQQKATYIRVEYRFKTLLNVFRCRA